jgi:membrane protein required for colicin V production
MGIVVGYIISVNSYGKVAGIFSNTGNDTAKLLSFVLIFVSCIIIAYILGAIAGKILKITGLGWVDRIGGGFLGFLKGFIVIVIIVMFLSAFLPADNTLLKDSLSVHYVPSAASTMNKFIPYELLEKIRIKVDGIKEGAGHI